MLGQQRTEFDPMEGSVATLRSAIADFLWAAKERLVWGTAEALRTVGEILKWPFERIAWALERGLIWPLQERTGSWGKPMRALAGLAVFALAGGAVAAGVLLARSPDGVTETAEPVSLTVVPASAEPVTSSLPFEKDAPAVPLLKGATPDFSPEADTGTKKDVGAVSKAAAVGATAKATAPKTAPAAKTTPADQTKSVGPAAIKVAREFAGAFVLYETARGKKSKIRATFSKTATPQLTRSLMKRPPRVPVNVQVPKAKVLNIVPGPRSGGTFTLSVSLLRVGITSELRIDMQRSKKSGKWRVTDVLG